MEHGVIYLQKTAAVMEDGRFLYGVMAEFEQPEALIEAARQVHDAGYRRIDAYTPFPLEGLSEVLGFHDYHVIWIMLIAGILGCLGGFGFLYYVTVISNPFDIAGRAAYGWPSYIPITFECTVLVSALSGVFGMFLLNGLPMPYHPVFDAPDFDKATSSRFFLCIEARDPRFQHTETRRFMETLGALKVSDVELRK